ncbi:MAG: thiolase family protein [Proteobacteria bacterium]|nr:thiolase family protein [Pseudomonadota bacterium]
MSLPARIARRRYDDVVIAAPVTIPYQRHSTQSAHWWAGRALRRVLEVARLSAADVDGLAVSSFSLAPDSAVGLVQHLGVAPRWLDHIPMGGASGVVALRRAARAVQAGDADLVVCVAADTNQVDSFRNTLAGFSRFAQDASHPYGAGGPNAMFALLTDHYMRRFGVQREDFGRLCVAQRANAARFEHALLRAPLTLEQYLAARPVCDPLHLFDCVMPCAGAEAFIVTRAPVAAALSLPAARLLATIERHNAFATDAIQERGGWLLDAGELWDMAQLGPRELDLVQTYDDYPVISMMQFEGLGLCAAGEAAQFVRNHTFTLDGTLPHNTSGGQLSVGQAGAAGGYLGLVEALRQVTRAALGNQVERARTALVSGFGMINYDRGICTGAAILRGD